jgi:hypothetical protein
VPSASLQTRLAPHLTMVPHRKRAMTARLLMMMATALVPAGVRQNK